MLKWNYFKEFYFNVEPRLKVISVVWIELTVIVHLMQNGRATWWKYSLLGSRCCHRLHNSTQVVLDRHWHGRRVSCRQQLVVLPSSSCSVIPHVVLYLIVLLFMWPSVYLCYGLVVVCWWSWCRDMFVIPPSSMLYVTAIMYQHTLCANYVLVLSKTLSVEPEMRPRPWT